MSLTVASELSTFGAFFTLLASGFGAGVLALPFAFASAGLVAAGLLLCVMALLSILTLYQLSLVCTWALPIMSDTPSFLYLVRLAGGRICSVIATVAMVVSQLGFCTSYLVFVAEAFGSLVPSLPLVFSVLLASIGPVILTQLRSTRLIVPVAIFVTLCLIGITVLIPVWLGVLGVPVTDPAPVLVHAPGLPVAWGVAAAALCVHGTAVSVFYRMRTKRTFIVSSGGAIMVLGGTYVGFGLVVAILVGRSVTGNLLLSLPRGSFEGFVFVLLAVALTMCYPLQMLPVSDLFDALTVATAPVWAAAHPRGVKVLGALERFSLVAATAVVAFSIPNFGSVLALTGALTVSTIMFVLPPILVLLAARPRTHGAHASKGLESDDGQVPKSLDSGSAQILEDLDSSSVLAIERTASKAGSALAEGALHAASDTPAAASGLASSASRDGDPLARMIIISTPDLYSHPDITGAQMEYTLAHTQSREFMASPSSMPSSDGEGVSIPVVLEPLPCSWRLAAVCVATALTGVAIMIYSTAINLEDVVRGT